jgi:hypothetical protein
VPHLRGAFFLYLKEKEEIMVQPIWKNYFVNLGSEESVEYVISYDSGDGLTAVYSGRAWKRPGEQSVSICINNVCEDWLNNTFPSLSESFKRQNVLVEFVVQKISMAGVYSEVARVRFINDWSYDANHDPEESGLAAPINGKVDARQWLLWTGIDVPLIEVKVTLTNGESFVRYVPTGVSADFSSDYNQDFSHTNISDPSSGSGTAVFKISQWGDVANVAIKGKRYDVVHSCSRYVLYYHNAYGGWDSLLIEGAASEEDSLTRYSMSKAGVYDRQKSNYLNEIEKKMTLHTSWLSDEQSLRMHHLLNSTDVYLHDLEKDVILPAVLNNSSTPYKTYKGEGGKLVNYAIEITIAQTRKRR